MHLEAIGLEEHIGSFKENENINDGGAFGGHNKGRPEGTCYSEVNWVTRRHFYPSLARSLIVVADCVR